MLFAFLARISKESEQSEAKFSHYWSRRFFLYIYHLDRTRLTQESDFSRVQPLPQHPPLGNSLGLTSGIGA